MVFIFILTGFILFFFLERFVYWYHGHGHKEDIEVKCEVRSAEEAKELALLNLLGDAVHNFIDGMIITASLMISLPVGFATTVAVFFHELPQEIGDFGILIYGGLKATRALILNFLSALTAMVGVFFAYTFSMSLECFNVFLVSFACGGFIYLAASEIIPELQRERSFKKSALQFLLFLLGVFLIWMLNLIF